MQKQMSTSMTYDHEAGRNYTRVLPDRIVGSCLQTADDARHLADEERVAAVLCLQQDSDMAYFDLDLEPVLSGCAASGIRHVRSRINDFDPYDLRLKLPAAAAALRDQVARLDPGECAYVHCTAGLGRAPAVAIAFMHWSGSDGRGAELLDALETVTSQRPCHPKIDAIRAATCDLLLGAEPREVTVGMRAPIVAEEVCIAGLDLGWENPAPCVRSAAGAWTLTRRLPPGRYLYKFVIDGRWTYSADHPVVVDAGGNANNFVDVVGGTVEEDALVRGRIMRGGPGALTPEERTTILERLDAISAAAAEAGAAIKPEPVPPGQRPWGS